MMKMKYVLSFATLSLVFASSCSASKSDLNASKTFPVSDFSSLDLEVIGEVVYEQSDSPHLTASGSSTLIEALQVSDSKGELSVELRNKRAFSGSKKELVIRVGSPRLKSIDYKGIGTLHLKGRVESDTLKITNKGVGKIKIDDCHVGTFDLVSKSIGTVEIKGTADEASLRSEGVGNVDASEFRSQKLEIVSKGTGNMEVYAGQSLSLSMTGIGSVKYYGNPAEVKTDISGLGKATRMDSSD